MRQYSIPRAALLTALAALAEAVLTPYLTFGWAAPKFTLIGIVVAVAGLKELQGVLLGFFGGILTDALSGGLFGVGALGGLIAGILSVRSGAGRRKAGTKLVQAQVVMVSVAAFDLINLVAVNISGHGSVPAGRFIITGVLPDVLFNGVLAYLLSGVLMRFVMVKEGR